MALNAERDGYVYPAFTYEVGRQKLREFTRATLLEGPGADDYAADAAEFPTGDLVAPTAFLTCVVGDVIPMVVDDPGLGGHWNLLHTAQEFAVERPVRGGDVLTCTPRIAELVSRSRMERLTIAVDGVDARDGSSVFSTRTTLVFFPEESS